MGKQVAKGSNIQQAGRDIYNNSYYSFNYTIGLSFEELSILLTSIKNINFGESQDYKGSLKRIDIAKKNEKNNLTDATFNMMKEKYLPLFEDIYSFLANPINKDIKEIYFGITSDINNTFFLVREGLPNFDHFILSLMNKVESQYTNLSHKDRDKYYLLFCFMYWYCDIGLKE